MSGDALPAGPPPSYEEWLEMSGRGPSTGLSQAQDSESSTPQTTADIPMMAPADFSTSGVHQDADTPTLPLRQDSLSMSSEGLHYGSCNISVYNELERGPVDLPGEPEQAHNSTPWSSTGARPSPPARQNTYVDIFREEETAASEEQCLNDSRAPVERRFLDSSGVKLYWINAKHFPRDTIITKDGEVQCPELVESFPAGKVTMKSTVVAVLSIICHVGFFVCLIRFVVGMTDGHTPGMRDLLTIFAAIFAVAFYLFILLEAYVSDTSAYLQNMMTEDAMKEYIEKQAKFVPEVLFTVETSHQTTGRSQSTVVTYEGSHKLKEFRDCISVSGDIDDLPQGQFIRIEFEKLIGFINAESKTLYQRSLKEYVTPYIGRDESMKHTENIDFAMPHGRATVYKGDPQDLGLLDWNFFCGASMCLLSWPYRWWIRSRSVKYKITFLKLLGNINDRAS